MPRRRVENSERTQNRGGGMQASAATGVLARTSDGDAWKSVDLTDGC